MPGGGLVRVQPRHYGMQGGHVSIEELMKVAIWVDVAILLVLSFDVYLSYQNYLNQQGRK